MMIVPLLIFATALAAADGPARREIELDLEKAKAVYEIKAAPGLSTTIAFPEPWAVTPVCGDCVFGDAERTSQLWRLDVSPKTNAINIKPTRLPGPDIPPTAFVTNIDVTLASGMSITLFIRLVLPEDADARVEFLLPEARTGSAILAKKDAEREAVFAQRVEVAATNKLLDSLVRGTKCRDFVGRPTRTDNVVVRLKQICRNGAFVYVVFDVEHRAAGEELRLAEATLAADSGETSMLYRFAESALSFNGRAPGIAAISIDPDALLAASYTLTVTEAGGKERVVEVTGITF